VNIQDFNRIIFIPTFRCQNRCSYCDYDWKVIEENKTYSLDAFGNHWTIKTELPWAYWLAALSRFRPYHLSLTGGEPTLWNGLVEFIEHLPRSCSWDITSNTLNEYAVDKMMPANIRTWTASYHFNNTEKFLQNIKVLRQRGFPVNVTLVLTPTNLEKVKKAVDLFNESYLRCNVHPMLKQGHDWNKHKKVLHDMYAYLRQIKSDSLIKFIDDIPKHYKPQGAKEKCPAGKNFWIAFPDGNVYRCYSHALSEAKKPMGEIAVFQPNKNDEPCEGGCLFPCDIQCQRGEHLDI
jgi:MoaA/NifB/PqqE/SkfB family radical SAM enzyme